MFRNATQTILLAGLIASSPWLLGADGGGCNNGSHPSTPDAGPAAGSGGSQAQAGRKAEGGSKAEAGTSAAQAGHGGQKSDAGTDRCVSQRGGPCGGNVKDPCTCASGLTCKSSSSLPMGDVGGTCQGPADDADAGMCVSNEGEHCGGNTRSPCTCATGLTCAATPGSTLPFGDVGGTCQSATTRATCSSDADCSLMADYCTGCDCVALAKGQSIAPCSGPGVRCLADPCASKHAKCTSGHCVAN